MKYIPYNIKFQLPPNTHDLEDLKQLYDFRGLTRSFFTPYRCIFQVAQESHPLKIAFSILGMML